MIVGAGVIGTLVGWALSDAGFDVVHFVRPGRMLKYQEGTWMDVLDKRKGHKAQYTEKYSLKLVESVSQSDGFNFVIVPVKHYQLEDTLRQIVPAVENANFMLLTQNWKGSREIDTLLPPSRYLFGDIKAGGGFREGKLVSTIKAIDLGQVNNRHDDCLDTAIDLFRSADFKVTVQENILHYLWVQYAINGGLWPILVRAGSFKSALSDRKLGNLGFFSVKECLEVVARRGVDLKKYPDAQMYSDTSFLSRQLAGIILKYMFTHNEYVKRNSVHALSDPKEIKTFYSDIVTTGKELGIDMPIMNGFMQDINNLSSL